MISIIIVNFHSQEVLLNCIKSIYDFGLDNNFDLIVSDNDTNHALGKKLKDIFPLVKYVHNGKNLGFGAGNNVGAKIAKGKYLMFLNPDTLATKNSIDQLVEFLDKHKKYAIASPLILDKDGSRSKIQGSMQLTPIVGVVSLSFINKAFPDNPISKRYYLNGLDFNKIVDLDVINGSAFLVRRSVFNELKGFDEKFFLYFEESDFCMRVKKLGYKMCIVPSSKIIHMGGMSTKNKLFAKREFVKSRFYYFKKHFGSIPAVFVEIFARFSKTAFLILIMLAVAVIMVVKL